MQPELPVGSVKSDGLAMAPIVHDLSEEPVKICLCFIMKIGETVGGEVELGTLRRSVEKGEEMGIK